MTAKTSPAHGFRLLLRSSLRNLARHPWQIALSVLGVALGVAVVTSIDLANASAQRAFALSTEAVTGRATHQLVAGPGGVPEELFRRLVLELGVHPAAPVVDGWVEVRPAPAATRERDLGDDTVDDTEDSRRLRLLGVDPFSERPFRAYLRTIGRADGIDVGAFLTRPGAVVLSPATAGRLGVEPGDWLPLKREAPGIGRLEVLALLPTVEGTDPRVLDDLLIADLATAQAVLDRLGRLDRVDLILPEGGAGEAARREIEAALPEGVQILAAAARSNTTREMTRAFRLNLQALALLALLCGMFLIYNTMTFSVVQRRQHIGLLRALGVTRRQIFALLLGEAAAVGLLGTLLGLLAGVGLGRGLVRQVTTTINDLYFVLQVRGLALDPWSLAKGAALGLGVTLLATVPPAREATGAPPRAVALRSGLEDRARRLVPRAAWSGLGLALAGTALLLSVPWLVTSFAGLFAILVGLALLTPLATVGLMRLAAPLLGRLGGVLGRMAARGVAAHLSRTAVAVAALMMAVAVTVGVGVLIDSFRGTVVRWLESTLQADLYVASADETGDFDQGPLPVELTAAVRALPGVAAAGSVRRSELERRLADGSLERTRVLALDMGPESYPGFQLTAGRPDEVWPAFQNDQGVIVSEVLAYRRDLAVGDELTLPTAAGPRAFPVVGVYVDYASDQGVALLSRAAWRRLFDAPGLSGVSVFLAPGANLDTVAEAVRRTGTERGLALDVRSNRALKERSLVIFDRTFLITGVLRLLAGIVAFIGVLSALMALQLERARELAVLRANGLTPRQVWRLVTTQTGLMGLTAGLLSLPVGLILAVVMIFVINRRSFGWSLEMAVPPSVPFEALALALVAAVLAGLYPAWRMARTSPALALREE